MRWLAVVALVAGCAELGVISDGTSISVGKPSRGYLIDGVRLPDRGEGFVTRDVWRARDNRFGTDELIDLITAVSRRMRAQVHDVKLVVADLSGQGGGERIAFHRSHQTGRDVDLLYYMRDASGQPFEPDAMHVFNARARARDGSGITIDVPRTWALVKELLTAPEANVQWIFMYGPIARRLIEHAEQIGEPAAIIARARMACRQPGDSARHDDHMHVRVYCSAADRAYGCVDIGPLELLAERETEPSPMADVLAALAGGAVATSKPSAAEGITSAGPSSGPPDAAAVAATATLGATLGGAMPASSSGPSMATAGGFASWGAMAGPPAGMTSGAAAATSSSAAPHRLGRLLRALPDRMYLRSWR